MPLAMVCLGLGYSFQECAGHRNGSDSFREEKLTMTQVKQAGIFMMKCQI